PDIIALPVERRRVVNLEEVLQQIAIGQARGIENDLDRLSVSLVITVCGVGNLAARIPDARRDYSVQAAQKILHAAEAAASKHCTFGHGDPPIWAVGCRS